MFVTNWISPTKIQKISEITNFFRHYFLSRTEVGNEKRSFGHGHFGSKSFPETTIHAIENLPRIS